jgi:hypothetical protein
MPDPYQFDNSTNLCMLKPNGTENPRGPNLPNQPTSPIIYLSPDMYEVNPGLDSSDTFMVTLNNLNNSQPVERQLYIQSMIDSKAVLPFIYNISGVNGTNSTNVTLVDSFKFTPVDNFGALWSEGKVLFKLDGPDREPIKGLFRLSAPDFVKRRLLQEDSEDGDNSRVSTVTPRKLSPSELWKTDGISQKTTIPAYKKTPVFISNMFEVVFGLVKLLIFAL